MQKVFHLAVHSFAIVGFVLVGVFFAVKFGLTNERGIIDNQREAFLAPVATSSEPLLPEPGWAKSEEWKVLKDAIIRDYAALVRAGATAGIPPRLIVAELFVEQMRVFTSNRELFKTAFSPLKLLANQSQFSWGVMGIKQDTAIEIEKNLVDTTSPFYLGSTYEHLLDFKTDDHDRERFMRITDENDRYYAYLYAALYIKEVEKQWQKAGYDISEKPDVIATLYDIGFAHSKPNPSPKSGGAQIDIAGTTYSFGSLAGEFYRSDELTDYFPK